MFTLSLIPLLGILTFKDQIKINDWLCNLEKSSSFSLKEETMERLCNALIFSSVNMPSALTDAICSFEDIDKEYGAVDSLDKL